MAFSSLILLAAALAATSTASAGDSERMTMTCVERMAAATGEAAANIRVTQEHATESGDLSLTLRTGHRVAHCTIRHDFTIACFDLMN
jgi:hypothetical protein